MNLWSTCSHASALIALLFCAIALTFAQSPGEGVYHIQTMGTLEVTLPSGAASGDILYRSRDGWKPLSATCSEGTLHFVLSSDDLNRGATTVTTDVRPWVKLDDGGPPEVVNISVDEKDFPPVPRLDLGGVETCPQTITVEIADADNWLRTKSYEVSSGGRIFRPRHSAVTLQKVTPRHARLRLDIPAIIGELRSMNIIVISADDWALDSEDLNCAIIFRHVQPHTLSDGTRLAVDSVTDNQAWADWTVVADGSKMDNSGGTTAGKTWLSEANDAPHWIAVRFPEPRTVTAVKIWWAYWNHYHTSRDYRIQARDGKEWTDLLRATPGTDEQCSHHDFDPVLTDRIRIWQAAGGGNPDEKQHMWISELEIFGPEGRLVPLH